MSDDLKDDLLAIDGVGDATAEKILGAVNDHSEKHSGVYLDKALDAADGGDDRNAAMYLRRYSRDE